MRNAIFVFLFFILSQMLVTKLNLILINSSFMTKLSSDIYTYLDNLFFSDARSTIGQCSLYIVLYKSKKKCCVWYVTGAMTTLNVS